MNNQEDFLNTLVEVQLPDPDHSFLKIRETLTRIGVASRKEKKLFQSVHILHKQGRYYLTSFKELFILDGKKSDFSEQDKGRRNTIAERLEEWGLVKIINKDNIGPERAPMSTIKVVTYKEKNDWQLVPKYNIASHKKIHNETFDSSDHN